MRRRSAVPASARKSAPAAATSSGARVVARMRRGPAGRTGRGTATSRATPTRVIAVLRADGEPEDAEAERGQQPGQGDDGLRRGDAAGPHRRRDEAGRRRRRSRRRWRRRRCRAAPAPGSCTWRRRRERRARVGAERAVWPRTRIRARPMRSARAPRGVASRRKAMLVPTYSSGNHLPAKSCGRSGRGRGTRRRWSACPAGRR